MLCQSFSLKSSLISEDNNKFNRSIVLSNNCKSGLLLLPIKLVVIISRKESRLCLKNYCLTIFCFESRILNSPNRSYGYNLLKTVSMIIRYTYLFIT